MMLGFDDNGVHYDMEVKEYMGKLPSGINGIRCINRILLAKAKFNDFIIALSIDDFEAIRAIFGKVIDNFTKELAFPKGVDNISEDSPYPNNNIELF